MAKVNFLIYGSYGFTGTLIAELACAQGLRPVLAGRDQAKLSAQANKLGLEYKVFDVSNLEETKSALKNFVAVLHCAGPFIKTFQNMAQACLETQTHYVDITGEVNVIEKLMELNKTALDADVMLLPGAGFDVVPSDCLAEYLKIKLPDATKLTLCINAEKSRISRGTARSAVYGLTEGSIIRENDQLKRVPLFVKSRSFQFDDQNFKAVSVAWGDLVTAWWSTNIPNIETYMVVPPKTIKLLTLLARFKRLLQFGLVKRFIDYKIAKMPEGPSADELKTARVAVYGEVVNAAGETAAALIHTPDAYAFTALAAIAIMKKILAGDVHAGFQTSSIAYSENLVMEIPGVTRRDV